MLSLKANTEMNVAEFLPEYPYYLFVFGDECKSYKYIFEGEACDEFILFSIIVNMRSGTYPLKIYGQDSSTNKDEKEAVFLFSEMSKIYNSNDYC